MPRFGHIAGHKSQIFDGCHGGSIKNASAHALYSIVAQWHTLSANSFNLRRQVADWRASFGIQPADNGRKA
jgi:hypothetical protein